MADAKSAGRKVEHGIEWLLLASRWLQAPLYIGLVVVLAVIVAKFPFKAWELVREATTVQESDLVVLVLSLVDVVMVANLVVMVIISGYDNFVSRIEAGPESERLAWFGRLDSGSLKVKLATSVVVISAIHLLQRFLERGDLDTGKLYALVVMHLAFVLTALLLAWTDRLSSTKGNGGH
jgi:uncharacterized protein (TIGR00645 family)